MTTEKHNTFDRDEMLKLAALDVFGLLDEVESNFFGRSLRDAPADLQDEIIAFQAELAADPSFQAPLAPPPDLRRKVLDRVARAVEEEAIRLAPIASIGKRTGTEVDPAYIKSLDRSFRIWRAASFVLAASVLVVFFLFARTAQEARQIAQLALERNAEAALEALIGPDLGIFVASAGTEPVAMRSEIAAPAPTGTVWLNDRLSQVYLLAQQLPEGRDYVLRATYMREDVEHTLDVQQFSVRGRQHFAPIRAKIDKAIIPVQTLAAVRWQVFDVETDTLLLST